MMHPFMSNWLRPSIANQRPPEIQLNKSSLSRSITEISKDLDFNECADLRIIQMDSNTFYQVHRTNGKLDYVNTQKGTFLKNGDKKYAEYLARYYLGDSTSEIRSMEIQTDFDTYYKEINRLLPVWKVEFERGDGMVLYIETSSSRLGTFNNHGRRLYINIFSIFHNWNFIPGPEIVRIVVVSLFSVLILLGSLAGFISYLFMFKARKGSQPGKRSAHRRWGIVFSAVLLMFSFSGAYHVLKKTDKSEMQLNVSPISLNDLTFPISKIVPTEQVYGFSVCKFNETSYYQIRDAKGWKYFNSRTGQELTNGEFMHARFLATQVTGIDPAHASSLRPIFKFKGEYGFINKRLPVVKVNYEKENVSCYVEPWTEKPAALISTTDRYEGLSFSMLHKFHFLDGLGRNTRDLFSIICSISIVIVALKGIKILRDSPKRNRPKPQR